MIVSIRNDHDLGRGAANTGIAGLPQHFSDDANLNFERPDHESDELALICTLSD
jgi:hypothetical protein